MSAGRNKHSRDRLRKHQRSRSAERQQARRIKLRIKRRLRRKVRRLLLNGQSLGGAKNAVKAEMKKISMSIDPLPRISVALQFVSGAMHIHHASAADLSQEREFSKPEQQVYDAACDLLTRYFKGSAEEVDLEREAYLGANKLLAADWEKSSAEATHAKAEAEKARAEAEQTRRGERPFEKCGSK